MINLGEVEFHPYGVFIPKRPQSIIVGSFPIAKFSRREKLKDGEIDFFYGGEKNQLWKLLGLCFNRELKSKKKIIDFLEEKGMAVGDIISSCQRKASGSLDSDLKNCQYFKGLREIIKKNSIKKIYFTSLKVQLLFQKEIGRIKGVKEILLISPSGGGIRRIAAPFEKKFNIWRKKNPQKTLSEFRVYIYKKIFRNEGFY